jgi:hypothetical protein
MWIAPRNAACRDILLEILIFKGFTARRLFKSFGNKGLTLIVVRIKYWNFVWWNLKKIQILTNHTRTKAEDTGMIYFVIMFIMINIKYVIKFHALYIKDTFFKRVHFPLFVTVRYVNRVFYRIKCICICCYNFTLKMECVKERRRNNFSGC